MVGKAPADSNPLFSVFLRLTVTAFRATIGCIVLQPAMLEDMGTLGAENDAKNSVLITFRADQWRVAELWLLAL